jgi:hypothetical protein
MTAQTVCSKTLRQIFTALVQFARTRPRNQRRTDCTDFENDAFQSLAFKSLYCIRSLLKTSDPDDKKNQKKSYPNLGL